VNAANYSKREMCIKSEESNNSSIILKLLDSLSQDLKNLVTQVSPGTVTHSEKQTKHLRGSQTTTHRK
jgi:hypothetical protein